MKNGSRGLRAYTFGAKGVWSGLTWILFLGFVVSAFTVFDAACLKLLLDIATGDSRMSVLEGVVIALAVNIIRDTSESVYLVAISKTQNRIAAGAKAGFLGHMQRIPQREPAIFKGLTSCVFALMYAFYLSWQMALMCIVLLPLPVICAKVMVPHIQKYSAVSRAGESNMKSMGQEIISYIPIIKSFCSYGQSRRKYSNGFKDLANARVKTSVMNAVLQGGTNIGASLSFVCTIAVGAYLANKGLMTAGSIVGFIQIQNYIVFPISELGELIGELQQGRVARARLKEIEDIPCEAETEAVAIDEEKMELRLDDVAFGYDGEPLFKNADFALKGKQFVGVMGPSGCGKSTLIKLLLALYEPSEGKIYLTDGEKDVKGTGIRHDIAYVPQDHPLMSGTILENIAYGEDEPDRERAVKAAEKAGISDFIEILPEKYDTFIKEKGDNVSFGQAQRIAIARAIYKDSPVLILDEPTASLDQSSKDRIMRTVKAESEKRLCIMICHDQTENREAFDAVIEFDGKGHIRLE